jgi:hypothetical protein
MKSIKYKVFSGLFLMLVTLNSCDLALQTNAEYTGEALDPHVNITAWEYIQNNPDLSDMMDAIEYSGLDSIYSQTKKKYTFMVIKNPALTTWANRLGYLTVKEVPKSDVMNLLKYHIIEGEYSGYHKPTPVVPIFVRNLLKGEDALITFKMAKSAWPTYDLSITTGNAVVNTQGSNGISPSTGSVTCNILTTNGVVHLFQKIAYYQRDKNYTPLFVPKNY